MRDEVKRVCHLAECYEVAAMRSYQTLVAWKRAHEALLLVLRATDAAYHPRSRSLFDQLRRATISVEANVVEGYALNTAPLCRRAPEDRYRFGGGSRVSRPGGRRARLPRCRRGEAVGARPRSHPRSPPRSHEISPRHRPLTALRQQPHTAHC